MRLCNSILALPMINLLVLNTLFFTIPYIGCLKYSYFANFDSIGHLVIPTKSRAFLVPFDI